MARRPRGGQKKIRIQKEWGKKREEGGTAGKKILKFGRDGKGRNGKKVSHGPLNKPHVGRMPLKGRKAEG